MDFLFSQLSRHNLDEQAVLLGVILLATILFVFTISLLFVGSKSPVRTKLEQMKNANSTNKLKKSRKFDHTLESLAPMMQSSNTKESESIRHKLMHAGYHDANALTVFYALKSISLVLGLCIAAALYFLFPGMPMLNFAMITSTAIGLFAPNILLNQQVGARQKKIRGGIADTLDLLVVCTESGLGFNAALRRVADEINISHPDFADELDTVCVKINAGVEMSDAFEDLIDRTGLVEIVGLVTMLTHASRIGGSLSQTLRDYTEDYRDKRNQELEEVAAKIPTKMMFPLLIFIWPCFFIVAIGPAMLQFTSTLGSG
ncbi:type II secretion system F family protein [Vibrio tetraodonis]|uniref:type II secretion system F family protein n=1 Tax=Vibrio tetraodonis TaxID=2231647 RepID=UPI000E09F22B|nr:type II secretion system F family protein [Vibrio tetraodonis]